MIFLNIEDIDLNSIQEKLKEITLNDIGHFLFRSGLFFLPSAFFIAAIFLILSLILSFFIDSKTFIKDKWNILFFISSILMIFSSFMHLNEFESKKLFLINNTEITWGVEQSWIGLGNWIPLFICFWGFQKYLSTSNDRKISAKLFIFGSMPVLFTSFGQYWFNWHGPMYFLNDLIIWYQRPLTWGQGVSGLFNNQNYNGCWLNIIWPFSLALLFEKTFNTFKKTIVISIGLSISVAIFITASRSSWGGFLLSTYLLLGNEVLFALILVILVLVLIPSVFQFVIQNFISNENYTLPEKYNLITQFDESNYPEFGNRLSIYKFALEMIKTKPFIGLGAATFSLYYLSKVNHFIAHPHNLFLEIGFSYGILASFATLINIFLLCFFSYRKIFLFKNIPFRRKNYFENAWWISFFVLLCSQMVDIQYFDGRISIAFWILLSGLREIIRDNVDIKEKINNNIQISNP